MGTCQCFMWWLGHCHFIDNEFTKDTAELAWYENFWGICWEHTEVTSGKYWNHYDDVIIIAMGSQITSLAFVYSTVYSGANERKHQSSASLAFVWGIHRGPVNSPHKWPVSRKMFPFDDVIIWIINSKRTQTVWDSTITYISALREKRRCA